MEHVSVDDVEPEPADGGSERRSLTDPLSTEHVAINRYTLEPGERFSGSVHAHMDQEEVFLVLAGEATFETCEGEVDVDSGEAIRFAPGEFQSGRNDGEEAVTAFALGAPRDSEDVRIAEIPVLGLDVSCPDCRKGEMRLSGREGVELRCPDCGGELNPSETNG